MIIQSLTADNFRKYKHLEINNIPQKGLITVSGSNESGKTSIADSLSFALFGRTFFTDEQHVQKLVRWGTKTASVVLNFSKQGKHYQLTRIVDHEGTVDAQLFNVDKAELIADTPKETERVLHDVLGYGYETFSDSFYLVQRELSTPHPNSDSIKDMVGIGAYAKISNDLHQDNEKDAAALETVRPKYEESYQKLQDLGIDGAWLPDLVDARETLETDDHQKQTLISQLSTSAAEYEKDTALFKVASKKHRWMKILSDLLLALLVIALAIWGLFKFLPEWAEKIITTTSSAGNFTAVSSWSESWMLLVAAGIAWSFFISLLYTWRMEDKKLTPLKDKAELFSSALSDGETHATTDIVEMIPSGCNSLLREGNSENISLSVPPDAEKQRLIQDLAVATKSYEADSELTAGVAKSLRVQLSDKSRQNSLNQSLLNAEIDIEMERTTISAALRKELSDYDVVIREHTTNIKVQNTAIDLLRSSSNEFTEHFNKSITKSSANVLPHFTKGHYSNIKIDENLNVGVFSKEKNDFMDFDEISSGTQRQIMLALRIAMSEELAKQNDNDQQFIILDEPFAFFDLERTIATLEKLPHVSDIITQVWVVSQEFPEGTQSDKTIACTLDDELTA